MKEFEFPALRFKKKTLFVLDQRELPQREVWIKVHTPDEMGECISKLCVRGAPLIAMAGVCSLSLFAHSCIDKFTLKEAAKKLKAIRPTAINLKTAVDYVMADDLNPNEITKRTEKLIQREIQMCEEIARLGTELIGKKESLLTYCNTGSLAAPGVGTALGIIRKAHQRGKNIDVYVMETRPLLQGARLTTWELKKANIPYTLICDNMAASLMSSGKIHKVLVGADRIAINGDFANKIGTYSLAVQAYYHNVPFYVAAPQSTIDSSCKKGAGIPIEQRPVSEIEGLFSKEERWAPENNQSFNPAFDITPVSLITGLILNTGVYTREELQSGSLKHLC